MPPQALLINRMMVDSVVEAPNGAHFTTAAPDYGRDETFQRHYAAAAASRRDVAAFVRPVPVRQRGRLSGRGAAEFAERRRRSTEAARDFRHPCGSLRGRVRGGFPR